MAEAVLEKFPDAKFAIGPAIDDGFITILTCRAATTEDRQREAYARADQSHEISNGPNRSGGCQAIFRTSVQAGTD